LEFCRTDAPWGISRISQDDKHAESNALKSAFDYKYNETPFEVNVYLVGMSAQNPLPVRLSELTFGRYW